MTIVGILGVVHDNELPHLSMAAPATMLYDGWVLRFANGYTFDPTSIQQGEIGGIVMYTPASFKMEDKEVIYDFMEQNSFAILFTHFNGLPYAIHLPIWLDRSEGCLYGHMARNNPQWQDINNDILVVFNGPHAYISPSWYETDQAVPTWNYAAVHVTGKFTLIEDHNELMRILDQTVNVYDFQ